MSGLEFEKLSDLSDEDDDDLEGQTGEALLADLDDRVRPTPPPTDQPVDMPGPDDKPATEDAPDDKPADKSPSDKPMEPKPFEVVNPREAAERRAQEIKDIAKEIKDGTFSDKAKEKILEALNTGNNLAERRRNFTDMVNAINRELTELNKGTRDPNKQFQIRFQDVRNPAGDRDSIRIGLQNRRNPNYNDEFTVRLRR